MDDTEALYQALLEERRIFITGNVVVFRWKNEVGWPVEYVSPNVRQVFGYGVEDFLSGRIRYADVLHPDDLARVAREVREYSDSGVEYFEHADYRIVRSDGEVRWLHDNTTVLRGPEGDIEYYLGYVTDVTARRRAEEERVAMAGQLVQAQKLESLGMLAGGIAHDFNNLLTAILGGVELASLAAAGNAEIEARLAVIRQAAEQGRDLCRNLLFYAGRQDVARRLVDVPSIVREVWPVLLMDWPEDIGLRLEPAEVGADLVVEGDPVQLRQVVTNLVTNARDAMSGRRGNVVLRYGRHLLAPGQVSGMVIGRPTSGQSYVYVSVADEGCGIAPEDLGRIFDPFFTRKRQGRGVGLATVAGIVRAHKGVIAVDSAPGRGTTVVVSLPEGGVDREVGARPAVGRRILVVDDNEAVRVTARDMLDVLGFESVVCASAGAALRALEREPEGFDAAMIDVALGKESGPAVAEALRRRCRHLAILWMSGEGRPPEAHAPPGTGAEAYLSKPFRVRQLGEALDTLVPRR